MIMKKFAKGFALAAVLVCLAFSMTACAGAGKYVNDTVGTTYNLKAGYKYEMVTEAKIGTTTTTSKQTGKWSKDGDTITFTPDDKNIPAYKGTLKDKTLTVGIVKYTKK